MTTATAFNETPPTFHPLTGKVKDIHAILNAHRGTMAPAQSLNQAFGSLVDAARTPLRREEAHTILAELASDHTLTDLHHLCAEGEFELEKHWAERIRAASNMRQEMRSFPYWTNYLKLAKLEMNALRSVMPEIGSMLFAGSGPLPLSAYMFAAHYGMKVTNVEAEEYAADCSVAWMDPILGDRKIPCHHMNIQEFTDFQNFDVVVMAALVGLTPAAKQEIIAHLHAHMQPGQLLMVRSVKGLRRLLYPEVTAKDLKGFEIVKEVHPRGEVVNSAVIARRV